MSTSILTAVAPQQKQDPDRAHKLLLTVCGTAAVFGTAALLYYGLGYYLTAPSNRPYHPRHAMLQPGGEIGLSLGVFGVFLFLLIFLYPLRKRWKWLGRMGNTRHWFNFHVLMGCFGPVVIAFHASFKFTGIAGWAYWLMFAVALSGIVGRYIYAQIPRSRNATELSLQELRDRLGKLTTELAVQSSVQPGDLAQLFRFPSPKFVAQESLPLALGALLWIDFCRPFRIARVRRRALGFGGKISTFGGLLESRDRKLERVIAIARDQARLSKKLLFLAKSQKILHLWHVVHRPFSYSFAVLALGHILIVTLFGFR